MSEPIFLQVLLFREPSYAAEFGRPLWAALQEVEALYNHGRRRAHFERYFLAAEVPAGVTQGEGFKAEKVRLAMKQDEWWQSFGGWTPSLPLDKMTLMKQVRRLLSFAPDEARLVVVADLEIEPPPNWRYIIWDGDGADSVASLKPTDPRYWGLNDPERARTIKHRVRAVCCSIVGQRLGFQRCGNPRCFLYNYVESVSHLDDMICFGKEHKEDELSSLGFPVAAGDYAEVEPVVKIAEEYVSYDNVDPSEFPF